jgi:hypothetical protein
MKEYEYITGIFTDKDVFDCKSKFGLRNVIKESGNALLQKKHSENQISI